MKLADSCTVEEYMAEYDKRQTTLEKQVGGDHYKKGVQPWMVALDWALDPWSHNVVKYILRFPHKNGKQDLEKIQHYVEFLLENYDEILEKYYD